MSEGQWRDDNRQDNREVFEQELVGEPAPKSIVTIVVMLLLVGLLGGITVAVVQTVQQRNHNNSVFQCVEAGGSVNDCKAAMK